MARRIDHEVLLGHRGMLGNLSQHGRELVAFLMKLLESLLEVRPRVFNVGEPLLNSLGEGFISGLCFNIVCLMLNVMLFNQLLVMVPCSCKSSDLLPMCVESRSHHAQLVPDLVKLVVPLSSPMWACRS